MGPRGHDRLEDHGGYSSSPPPAPQPIRVATRLLHGCMDDAGDDDDDAALDQVIAAVGALPSEADSDDDMLGFVVGAVPPERYVFR
eukprot:296317-Pyramimonas_sp.AAC.1